MLLSIVVPVFNGEKKIARCLESLAAVKSIDVEFIIVNDGSTDGTKIICEDYIKKDSRFHLINQNNGGVSKARNSGLDISQGKYIGFVDADDELTADYNKIIETLKNVDSDFYAFEHFVQTPKELKAENRYLFKPGKNGKRVLYNNFLTGISNQVWNNIYQSDIINKYQIRFPEDMSMGEDCVFNARYLQYCQEVYYINQIGYKYYIDDKGSATNARKLSYLKDFMKIYESFLQIYSSYENLEFPFYCPYYVDKVYEILRENRKEMNMEEKTEFKNSRFYHELMNYKYKSRRQRFRKWIIMIYLHKT